MRSYASNKQCCLAILSDKQVKLRETIAVFKVLTMKKPEQKDVVFQKGMDNLSKYIVTMLNTFLLSLGSVDSSAKAQFDDR